MTTFQIGAKKTAERVNMTKCDSERLRANIRPTRNKWRTKVRADNASVFEKPGTEISQRILV